MRHIGKEIKNFDPDVVGVTATTRYIYDALEILKNAKKNNPNCLSIVGGPHATVRAKELLQNNSYVDAVVRGEGEKTLTELLENWYSKNLSGIKGISYRANEKIIENIDRELIQDLDALPFPAYHLLPMKKYSIGLIDGGLLGKQGQQYGAIITSRGCPHDCIFCSSRRLWGRKWRARSPENVVEELEVLTNKYGKEVIHFMDDTFTVDKKRTIKICKLIRDERIDVSIICVTRVDVFNEEIASELKKAGCSLVYFGFESGVQKTLDILNKNFKLEDSVKAVNIAKKVGIDAAGFFVMGLPGETREMINKTINFASKLGLKSAEFNIVVPYPGTKLYKTAEENNMLLTTDWSKYETSKSVMKLPGLKAKELKELKRKAYFRFNLS
jgi:radical SAM superfamily enzyme YgiQ (UPF0313 family)